MLAYIILPVVFFTVGLICASNHYNRMIEKINREHIVLRRERWKAGYDSGVAHARRMRFFNPVINETTLLGGYNMDAEQIFQTAVEAMEYYKNQDLENTPKARFYKET